ncbi:NAD(P)-binding protein [Dothidotthia symphoricarpi CBS 119687]|uniref:NAD(P)-binding protein n=1 Tax=Dothidotthia symphoricarpi CBS 119687 TaxID=1392245 RepID=A0A6A5ZWW6_9PLEO|nr:NAD(P)-binding protein [Dothidotthia symphoricarpi CBS 119687]KAF2123515.1 NAD(P)-binding protein [Dothidotthia symphoricarpi CBS 119687]
MSVFRPNATALITGGASGIGYAVAQLCLKHEMKVTIVDFNAETLDLASKNLGKQVQCIQADVGKREDWADIKQKAGNVDFLMLNAGVAKKGTWGDDEYFDAILQTNLHGVTHGLNTYIPALQSRSTPSAVVITGSKQGITNPPGNPAYNASKAAVKALAEHLAYDLRDTNTSVHLLVPGWTFTGLSGNIPGAEQKSKPNGAWSPAQVAEYMYAKMQDGKFYIICPDNDVDETTDKKRMLWTTGDIVHERPPLTRWRDEFREEAEAWMAGCRV